MQGQRPCPAHSSADLRLLRLSPKSALETTNERRTACPFHQSPKRPPHIERAPFPIRGVLRRETRPPAVGTGDAFDRHAEAERLPTPRGLRQTCTLQPLRAAAASTTEERNIVRTATACRGMVGFRCANRDGLQCRLFSDLTDLARCWIASCSPQRLAGWG